MSDSVTFIEYYYIIILDGIQTEEVLYVKGNLVNGPKKLVFGSITEGVFGVWVILSQLVHFGSL